MIDLRLRRLGRAGSGATVAGRHSAAWRAFSFFACTLRLTAGVPKRAAAAIFPPQRIFQPLAPGGSLPLVEVPFPPISICRANQSPPAERADCLSFLQREIVSPNVPLRARRQIS